MKGIIIREGENFLVSFDILSEYHNINNFGDIELKIAIKKIPIRFSDVKILLDSGENIIGKEIDFEEEFYSYVSGGLKITNEIGGKGLEYYNGSYAKINF